MVEKPIKVEKRGNRKKWKRSGQAGYYLVLDQLKLCIFFFLICIVCDNNVLFLLFGWTK